MIRTIQARSRVRRGGWGVGVLLLLSIHLFGQDEANFGQTDWVGMGILEARFPLGETEKSRRWEARFLVLNQLDDGVGQYASTVGGPELLYHAPNGLGDFSVMAYYLSLRGARTGAVFRAEWQKLWVDSPLAPIATIRQERLHVVDLPTDSRILLNWRTRVRLGIVPRIGPKWRLLVIAEWFPYQQVQGFSEEYRSVAGFSWQFFPKVGLAFGHLGRLRTYTEARLRWQHTVFWKVTYTD